MHDKFEFKIFDQIYYRLNYLLNALAMATFAKTATKGTTMIPDPNSEQT